MERSLCPDPAPPGLHVAIIMDGNGRWAAARGRPRLEGHRAGADAVRRVVEAAPGQGIGTLTLYAFSADNWGRPTAEVAGLLELFRAYLEAEADRCVAHGICMKVIGRRDRLPSGLRQAVERVEALTVRGRTMRLRLAVDYSARDAILQAARGLHAAPATSRQQFALLLGEAIHSGSSAPDVDLLIRTGGEQRLSDFLLWESAYAELVFTRRMWPDFDAADLEAAVREFQGRERRFGLLPQATA
ncbi:MAG: di-trans,poly-cis-decaprenylcistransferase [Acidobacteria bacterium]|nr:di-trans,poly-cis-decaprenylcistransferase [Acidobacteriota bacterium]